MPTPYHAKYFAHDITRRQDGGGEDRLSMSLFNACVDLNPHQIEAALFALRTPLSKGVLLADEVGLGKSIEGGLVFCQLWAERRRKLLVIAPAALRKQWAGELEEKFNLPTFILDARSYKAAQADGATNPFESARVVITSFNFASRERALLKAVGWDLVIIDEAHKLRNAYRPGNVMGQNLRWALEGCQKLLLTATPLQNSLMELYGLSTLIDEHIFGDVAAFRDQYLKKDADLGELKGRLRSFCQRTLRKHVLEYISYTQRRALTRPFEPSDAEQRLYEAVSDFLIRPDTYAIPHQQRHLTVLILRKLLASSSLAIAGTLETMQKRLQELRDGAPPARRNLFELVLAGDEMEEEYLDELLTLEPTEPALEPPADKTLDLEKLDAEIAELGDYSRWARSVGVDAKAKALLQALEIGFGEMSRGGAARKALIFTESRRTQEYVQRFLEANGYLGQIVLFNGSNADASSKAIYTEWARANAGSGRATGSRAVDMRSALVDYFREEASVMIATEAAAEGVNLQFCSLVVNYDLPWNPQRIEQRIGRCHRYGQKHDVVVINFLNQRNEADRRVMELLSEKFLLFEGVFGSSDEILGTIESGVDFEKRILAIYQQCRTSQEIEAAFAALQNEMEASIQQRMDQTRQLLLEHFDADVHDRLKGRLQDTRANLDRVAKRFWALSKVVLGGLANFDDAALGFHLHSSPTPRAHAGHYHLISKNGPNQTGEYLYRLSHPLGEYALEGARALPTPVAQLVFHRPANAPRSNVLEALQGKTGYLRLDKLEVQSYGTQEHLLFAAMLQDGSALDQETCEKLFSWPATVNALPALPPAAMDQLQTAADRHASAALARALEDNNQYFLEERQRLESWAEGMMQAAEKELDDTKRQIKAAKREARTAVSAADQLAAETRMQQLNLKQSRLRRQIFAVEDEIAAKRDAMINALQKRMAHSSRHELLFLVAWRVQ